MKTYVNPDSVLARTAQEMLEAHAGGAGPSAGMTRCPVCGEPLPCASGRAAAEVLFAAGLAERSGLVAAARGGLGPDPATAGYLSEGYTADSYDTPYGRRPGFGTIQPGHAGPDVPVVGSRPADYQLPGVESPSPGDEPGGRFTGEVSFDAPGRDEYGIRPTFTPDPGEASRYAPSTAEESGGYPYAELTPERPYRAPTPEPQNGRMYAPESPGRPHPHEQPYPATTEFYGQPADVSPDQPWAPASGGEPYPPVGAADGQMFAPGSEHTGRRRAAPEPAEPEAPPTPISEPGGPTYAPPADHEPSGLSFAPPAAQADQVAPAPAEPAFGPPAEPAFGPAVGPVFAPTAGPESSDLGQMPPPVGEPGVSGSPPAVAGSGGAGQVPSAGWQPTGPAPEGAGFTGPPAPAAKPSLPVDIDTLLVGPPSFRQQNRPLDAPRFAQSARPATRVEALQGLASTDPAAHGPASQTDPGAGVVAETPAMGVPETPVMQEAGQPSPGGPGRPSLPQPGGLGQPSTSQPDGPGLPAFSQPAGLGQPAGPQPGGLGQLGAPQPTGLDQSAGPATGAPAAPRPGGFGQPESPQPSGLSGLTGPGGLKGPGGLGGLQQAAPTPAAPTLGNGQPAPDRPAATGRPGGLTPGTGFGPDDQPSGLGQAGSTVPADGVLSQSAPTHQPGGFGRVASTMPSGLDRSAEPADVPDPSVRPAHPGAASGLGAHQPPAPAPAAAPAVAPGAAPAAGANKFGGLGLADSSATPSGLGLRPADPGPAVERPPLAPAEFDRPAGGHPATGAHPAAAAHPEEPTVGAQLATAPLGRVKRPPLEAPQMGQLNRPLTAPATPEGDGGARP
ncbi:hypothetical protein ACWKSP_16975 [Micromonosporaceae bacterium Da 78-11]